MLLLPAQAWSANNLLDSGELPQAATLDGAKAPQATQQTTAQAAGAVREAVQPQAGGGGSMPQQLTLHQFVSLVREKNDKITYHQLKREIAKEDVKGARAIYEPNLVASVKAYENFTKNTAEEAVSRSDRYEFKERNVETSTGVETLVPTGAKVKVGVNYERLQNSLQEAGDEHTMYPNITVTQPLLKDAGTTVTNANINLSESLENIALQDFRLELMKTMSQAASAYWRLYQAQEVVKIREESARNASQVLSYTKEEVRYGRKAESEVLDIEAGIALREAKVSEARQNLQSAVTDLRGFLFETAVDGPAAIHAVDNPGENMLFPNVDASLANAFKLRPEYLANVRKAEYEDIRIAYAENQRWPQLDLKMSYGLNGLEPNAGEAWDDSWSTGHPSWSVGLEMKIPLGGNKSKSDLASARYRKRQALLDIKSTEISIANSVDTAIRKITTAREQLAQHGKVVALNNKSLDIEFERFRSGKSNSKLVLEREERLNKAMEDRVQSLVSYEEAIIALKLAEGTLLQDFDIKE